MSVGGVSGDLGEEKEQKKKELGKKKVPLLLQLSLLIPGSGIAVEALGASPRIPRPWAQSDSPKFALPSSIRFLARSCFETLPRLSLTASVLIVESCLSVGALTWRRTDDIDLNPAAQSSRRDSEPGGKRRTSFSFAITTTGK